MSYGSSRGIRLSSQRRRSCDIAAQTRRGFIPLDTLWLRHARVVTRLHKRVLACDTLSTLCARHRQLILH